MGNSLNSKQRNETRPIEPHLIHTHKTSHECLKSSVVGFCLGFFGIFVPISLRKQKVKERNMDIQIALAAALLLGGFRGFDCIFWRILEQLKNIPEMKLSSLQKYSLHVLENHSTSLAMGIATWCSLLIDKTVKNSVVVLWLLLRSVRCFVPTIPYGEVFVMCLSTAQLLSTWIRCPWEHAPSYLSFLYIHGGIPKETLKPYMRGGPKFFEGCSIVHPGTTCVAHPFYFFPAAVGRAIPLYFPIHFLALLFSRQPLETAVLKFMKNMIWSCAFLASYCTLAWISSCFWFNLVRPGVTRANLFSFLWIPGFALLLEYPNRRIELSAYCLTHALNTLWNHWKQRKGFVPRDWVSTLLITFSMAIIFQFHYNQPHFITKILFGLHYEKKNLSNNNNATENKDNSNK